MYFFMEISGRMFTKRFKIVRSWMVIISSCTFLLPLTCSLCVYSSLTLPLSSQFYMYMHVHICISFSLINKLLKIWHVSHSHLQSKQHLTWCLSPHRGATNIWNTCTKICASETCNLTPFFGFSLNIQSTSELELKTDGQYSFYYTNADGFTDTY